MSSSSNHNVGVGELAAYAVFVGYFALIFFSLYCVSRSVVHQIPLSRLAEQKPFLFIRSAIASLSVTWYYMFQFMKGSYKDYVWSHPTASFGQWSQNTALFEQAWTEVSKTPGRWAISSGICTWTVLFTLIVWSESAKRGIKHPWAYMLLGQLVAISFSTGLFITASTLRPRSRQIDKRRIWSLLVPLAGAMATIYRQPKVVGTSKFMPNLLAMHGSLLLPLFFSPRATTPPPTPAAQTVHGSTRAEIFIYAVLGCAAALIHKVNFDAFEETLGSKPFFKSLWYLIFSHPAQGSISFDVISVIVTLFFWGLTTGSWTSLFLKSAVSAIGSAAMWISETGVNWTSVASIVPIGGLASFGVLSIALGRLRKNNEVKRKELSDKMGIIEENVVPGTDKKPPAYAPRRTVVGFWHPYCNAGGGGERVLWTAIAHVQKAHPDVVSLVYSGDFPTASKDEILSKIKERFSIELLPETLHFVPLPSRYLVDDTYWSRFTLLGQSLGSVYLAYEGLCGKQGLWGDLFIDTMGYAFTFPFVRLVTGGECVIGSYTHYPTVSSDMANRVRNQAFGVESRSGPKSWLQTQLKLIYYKIFTNLYSVCLLFCDYTMGNSSWTHAHLTSLITQARSSTLASLFLLDNVSHEKNKVEKAKCEVSYPPCDTTAFSSFPLNNRANEIVSLAQFRPEKEHWKQVEALSILFQRKPELRGKWRLVMMGGARHPADEQRVVALKALAKERGVEDSIDFVVNAPYSEVIRRLSKASLGLNTMQDEHFGINIVEFMAAGSIPIVHASAGPVMDIVVPYEGQRTGFHAKTPEEFAVAIEEALALSESQQTKVRKAARQLAVEKFSEKRFNEGWEKGWVVLTGKVAERRKAGQEGK